MNHPTLNDYLDSIPPERREALAELMAVLTIDVTPALGTLSASWIKAAGALGVEDQYLLEEDICQFLTAAVMRQITSGALTVADELPDTARIIFHGDN